MRLAALILLCALGCERGCPSSGAEEAPIRPSNTAANRPTTLAAAADAHVTAPDARSPAADAFATDVEIEGNTRAAAPSFTDARSAMAELVAAVLAREPARVLACFSRQRPWVLTSIAGGKRSPTPYSFAQLEQGLAQGGDFRDVIFGESPDDNLHQEIALTGQAPWVAERGATFTPPGEPRDVFVSWRREGGRFVVAEIAFPF